MGQFPTATEVKNGKWAVQGVWCCYWAPGREEYVVCYHDYERRQSEGESFKNYREALQALRAYAGSK